MYLPPALVALSLLALRASAFLIPPTTHDVHAAVLPEQEKDRTVSILAGLPQTIALDCPGCPFDGQDNVDNKIHLQIEASLSRGLVINDVSVLPSAFDAPSPVSIAAFQMSLEDGRVTTEQPLDFALERLEPITSRHEKDTMLIPVRFTVLAIGGTPVKTDTVSISLLRSRRELALVSVDMISFEETPGVETCDGEQSWSMCRIRAIITARVKGMVKKMVDGKDRARGWAKGGCRGRFNGMNGPKGFGWIGGRRPGRHHGHHRHHHAHPHWRSHRYGRMLHRTIKFFFIPALLGVVGGLMASAVGMLVGQVLVFLWQRFYRAGQQPSPRVIEIVVRDDEKALLMGEDNYEDAPPMYQDIEAAILQEKH